MTYATKLSCCRHTIPHTALNKQKSAISQHSQFTTNIIKHKLTHSYCAVDMALCYYNIMLKAVEDDAQAICFCDQNCHNCPFYWREKRKKLHQHLISRVFSCKGIKRRRQDFCPLDHDIQSLCKITWESSATILDREKFFLCFAMDRQNVAQWTMQAHTCSAAARRNLWKSWHNRWKPAATCVMWPSGALVQWLKLPAWKVRDRGFEPHSGFQISKKQKVSSPLTRKYLIL